jgi:hypothetical protein
MQIYFDGNFQTIAWEYTTTPARTSWCTNYYLPAATTVVTFVVNGSDEWTLDGVAFTK